DRSGHVRFTLRSIAHNHHFLQVAHLGIQRYPDGLLVPYLLLHRPVAHVSEHEDGMRLGEYDAEVSLVAGNGDMRCSLHRYRYARQGLAVAVYHDSLNRSLLHGFLGAIAALPACSLGAASTPDKDTGAIDPIA